MPVSTIPERPRLAEHVLARRHVVDGQERVMLYDQRRGEVMQLGAREWTVLEAADGTRGLEGIVVAARRRGAHARVTAVRSLLQSLLELGMLDEGPAAEPDAQTPSRSSPPVGLPSSGTRTEPEPEIAAETPLRSSASVGASSSSSVEAAPAPARPLVAMPGDGLRCDGGGTCCRLYGTVMLARDEARRAQSLLPSRRVGPVPVERWTTPLRGSEPGVVLALIARDGACGMLDDDGLCAVHRAGGAAAKPVGCQLFPRVFVDDGQCVRVALKPECPCVLDPGEGVAEPLIEAAWSDASTLPAAIVVDRLPHALEIRPGTHASRAEVRAWVAGLAARPVPVDLAATLWALADAVAIDGLASTAFDRAWSASPPSTARVRPWLEALYQRARARAREHAAWRSARDLVRQTSAALTMVTLVLRQSEALAEALSAPAPHPQHEARYWASGLHAYRWFGRRPLVTALRDEALRLWVARSLPVGLESTATVGADHRAPLALVEALLRAHGVGAYVDDVASEGQGASPE